MFTRLLNQSSNSFRSFAGSVIVLALVSTSTVYAGGIRVAAGDINMNDGNIDLGCGTLTVEGEFNMGTGTLMNVASSNIDGGTLNGDDGMLYISGDFLNDGGTFNGDNSQVMFTQDCDSDTINVTGNNDFNNMTIDDDSGREIRFEGGATQTFAGDLVMKGSSAAVEGGALLRVSSSGGPANIAVNGTYDIFAVNVSDNHALAPGEWINFGQPDDFDSVDSGGNARWFRNAPPGVDSIRIQVSKFFNDGNTGEVDVTLDCNTGLPIVQTQGVSEGNPVNFVVTAIDATQEGPNCRVYEETESGYSPNYEVPAQSCHPFTGDCFAVNDQAPTGCFFEDIHPNDGGSQNFCEITNTLLPSTLTVDKVWLDFDDHPSFFINDASVQVNCSAVADGEQSSFIWYLSGNDESQSFDIYPRWQGDTVCSVTENVFEQGIISEGCDGSFAFTPGSPAASCELTNSFFAEGIPTLSQWGLIIMTLLMMGLGMVAVRKLV